MSNSARKIWLALLVGSASVASAAAPLSLPVLPPEPVRPLVSAPFCNVAGVDRNLFGVAIHFTRRVSVTITEGDGYKSSRKYDPAFKANAEQGDTEGSVLYLEPGADFVIADSSVGNCHGKVERKGGRLGVQMRAGSAQAKKGRFIPSEPAKAIVRETNRKDYEFYASWPTEAGRIPKLNALLTARAQEQEADLAKISGDQATERAEINVPRMVTLAMYNSTLTVGSNKQLLSLMTDAYVFTGGAHGYPGAGALLWDRRRGKVAVTSLFSDGMSAFQKPWCNALDAEREVRSEGAWTRASGKKYLDLWECPTLDKLVILPMGAQGKPFDRIRFIATAYVAGPYSDGQWDFTFPVTPEVLALVKPEYRAAFRVYQSEGK